MNDANEVSEGMRFGAWRKGRAGFLKVGLVLGSLSAMTGLAHAQAAKAPDTDESLTYKGVTLYGIVDLGLQYQTHGAPINDFFPAGSADIVQKNSNHSILGITPNNLSNSRIGLNGKEALFDDWSAVFKLETFFNPQSGEISDALKSLAQNNGRTVASGTQTTNLDSSIAGQTFQQSYLGFSSKSKGTIVFGRQNTLIADGVAKYDPNQASQAFSLIGLSGTTAGGGDTQNRRFDQSVEVHEHLRQSRACRRDVQVQRRLWKRLYRVGTPARLQLCGIFAGWLLRQDPRCRCGGVFESGSSHRVGGVGIFLEQRAGRDHLG